jgi:hypothetical protein
MLYFYSLRRAGIPVAVNPPTVRVCTSTRRKMRTFRARSPPVERAQCAVE